MDLAYRWISVSYDFKTLKIHGHKQNWFGIYFPGAFSASLAALGVGPLALSLSGMAHSSYGQSVLGGSVGPPCDPAGLGVWGLRVCVCTCARVCLNVYVYVCIGVL